MTYHTVSECEFQQKVNAGMRPVDAFAATCAAAKEGG
jgi:hypothetical protein